MTPHSPKNVFSSSSRGRPKNALETSRINLQGTSRGRRIRTSLGRHFKTSLGRQIWTFLGHQFGMSRGWSNRIFRGRWSGTFSGCSGYQYLPVGRILHCYHNLFYVYYQFFILINSMIFFASAIGILSLIRYQYIFAFATEVGCHAERK